MSELHYNCTDVDLLLCDYIDRGLTSAQRTAFEEHLHGCASCTEMVNDSREVLGFVDRCAEVEPPPELLTRIMHQLPASQNEPRRARGLNGLIGKWFRPVMQPRFAMGMAMTILSFSMLGKFFGPVKPIRAADLDPIKIVGTIDDKMHRLWNNTVKYYENLRVVYEIQSRLREWNQEEEQARQNEQQQQPPQSSNGEKK